jgi:hypothetical protein
MEATQTAQFLGVGVETRRTIVASLLTEREAANMLRVAPRTLKDWRLRPWRGGAGPAYIKMGKLVRYRLRDLECYLKQRAISGAKNVGSHLNKGR